MARLLIVSMPWCAASRPNLSAGLLKALARRAGSEAEVHDASLDFAVALGGALYEALAETSALFGVCEHVFAADLFGGAALDSDAFLEGYGLEQARSPFFEVRDRIVPAFLGQAAEQVLQGDWDAVGFTCTFNQVFPSLALAARLKRARPELVTLLGGACVHGAMGEEYARAFRGIVDHVFLGEADETLPRFLRSLDAGGDPVAIPGITVGGASTGAPASTSDLESLPTPDYDDWFARRAGLAGTGEALPEATALPYESSRGCWWGAKHHCTFCGLNNLGMAFRSKSPGRVGQEIAELAGRHRLLRFMAADNIITHHDFQALVATLAGLEGDYRFFYEIKANLKRDELCDLAAAGVRWVQPGIESFSDGLLGLMRKGTTGLQNVQLLRLCAEFGIHPSYNLLVGFPGERDSDYEEMLSVIDAIGHLIPPSGAPGVVQIHRFSPFYDEPERFGFENVRPAGYYRHLVPQGHADPAAIAYFFERDLPADSAYARHGLRLAEAVERWREAGEQASGRLGPGFIEVERRAGAGSETRRLDRLESCLLLLADRVVGEPGLVAETAARTGARETDVQAALANLLAERLLVGVRGRLVASLPFERPKRAAELTDWLERHLPRRPSGARRSRSAPAPAATAAPLPA